MSRWEKYNMMITGVVAGLIVPLVVMLLFYFWKAGGMSVAGFIERLLSTGTLTNAISVSVFTNVFIFLLFNRLDMLRASRGILGITIAWAILVFILKFS